MACVVGKFNPANGSFEATACLACTPGRSCPVAGAPAAGGCMCLVYVVVAVCGYVGMWVCGCVGVWVRMYVRVFVGSTKCSRAPLPPCPR